MTQWVDPASERVDPFADRLTGGGKPVSHRPRPAQVSRPDVTNISPPAGLSGIVNIAALCDAHVN